MTEATKKTESAGTTASKKPVGKVADTTSNKASNKASKNTAAKLAMNGSASPILLPEGYRPSEEEEFMNPLQLLYFRKKLEAWLEVVSATLPAGCLLAVVLTDSVFFVASVIFHPILPWINRSDHSRNHPAYPWVWSRA